MQLGCSWGAVGRRNCRPGRCDGLAAVGFWPLDTETVGIAGTLLTALPAAPLCRPRCLPSRLFSTGEIGYDYVSTADDDNLDADDLTQVLSSGSSNGSYNSSSNDPVLAVVLTALTTDVLTDAPDARRSWWKRRRVATWASARSW